MLYMMTNSADQNQVVAFRRGCNGTLTLMDFYNTGGRGTGETEVSPATPNDGIDPLASQGSLVLSCNGKYLFAVNAASNSISVFRVALSGSLQLVNIVLSGGLQPNSLAVFEDLLCVTNVGSSINNFNSNISVFRIHQNGQLTMISNHDLSTPNAQPACVLFNSAGNQVVVSELTTDRLSVFRVNTNGTLSGPTVNNSNGSGPFGACFLSSGLLLVAEAGTNALSSYTLCANGVLQTVSSSVLSNQVATCWVVATQDEHYAFTSDAGSNSISTYCIDDDGTIALVTSTPSTPEGSPLGAPIDSGVSHDGNNFYVLNGNQGSISVFYICQRGQLYRLQVIDCLQIPNLGVQGLAVR
jgi:6-phosphogluconolactonase (cycloisomerase 2 family)